MKQATQKWFPEQAAVHAEQIDLLFFVLLGISVVFTVLIFSSIIFFARKYRRGSPADRKLTAEPTLKLEIAWTAIPALIGLAIFVWAAKVYFDVARIPADALEVYVVGKQWMWKLQHEEGPSEINELHVPIGRPVKLIMISQDVIHSFFVPAFRAKRDVLPGRYQSLWFIPTKPGEYHIFCAEYCGTEHSRMIGRVVVMQPNDYALWISKMQTNEPPVASGKALFQKFGCAQCHGPMDSDLGPSLATVFQSTKKFSDGSETFADENYLREAILKPAAKVAGNYSAKMPSYAGQLDDEETFRLIAYIKSLGTQQTLAEAR